MASFACTQRLGLASSSLSGQRLPCHSAPRRAAPFCSQPVTAGVIGPGKKWEHYDLTKNGKPVSIPMHVQTGDTVQVIAGSAKGTVGQIERVITKTGQVVVSGVNVKTKHNKPKAQGESGQITKTESPIHHSNVMLYSTEQKVASRVGYRIDDKGNKVRYLVKTGEVVPPGKSNIKSEEA